MFRVVWEWQCENGQIACASCSKLTKHVCPSCKRLTGSIQNPALEKLIESVKVKCKFAVDGCKEAVKFAEKDQHERVCSFAPLSCPFPQCNEFQGKYELPQKHFKQTHPGDWDALPSWTEVKFSVQPTDRFHFLSNTAAYFVVQRRTSSVGGMCYLTFPKILSNDYDAVLPLDYHRYVTILSNGDDEASSTFKVEAECCPDDCNSTPQDLAVVRKDKLVDIALTVNV